MQQTVAKLHVVEHGFKAWGKGGCGSFH